MNEKTYRPCQILLIFFSLLFLLSACSGPAPTVEPTIQIDTEIPPTATPVDTPTPVPVPDKVVLVRPSLEGLMYFNETDTILNEFASTHGWIYEIRDSLQASDIGDGLQLVVFLSQPDNLSELTAAAPQTRFLVVSSIDLPQAENLSVIRLHRDQELFLAGYMAMVLTDDWRVGGLLPADTGLGTNLTDAFQNGGGYYCGICNTQYGPFVDFPVVAALPSASEPAAWQYGLEELEKFIIYTLYVAPESYSDALWNQLAVRNLVLIGGATPPQEMRSIWAATISQDAAAPLKTILPELAAGKSGIVIDAEVKITDVNRDLLSEGKQKLIEKLILELRDGMIYPLTPALD